MTSSLSVSLEAPLVGNYSNDPCPPRRSRIAIASVLGLPICLSVLSSSSKRELSRRLIELHDFCTLEAVAFFQCGPVEYELHDVLLGWCGLHAVDDGLEAPVDVDITLDLGSNWSGYL
jgi:hypothetical protein